MINQIIERKIIPTPQTGKITEFTRRTPEQSNIFFLDDIDTYIIIEECLTLMDIQELF